MITTRHATARRGERGRVCPNPTPTTSDDDMAIRCYNCGNDPGTETDCEVCGAPLAAASSDMFSVAAHADSPFATNGASSHEVDDTAVARDTTPRSVPEPERDPYEPPSRPQPEPHEEPHHRYERVGAGMWATGTPKSHRVPRRRRGPPRRIRPRRLRPRRLRPRRATAADRCALRLHRPATTTSSTPR